MEFWRPPGMVPLAWLAATTLAVGVAWVGLRPVLDTAVPDRAAPLSAADVRHLAVPSVSAEPRPSMPTASGSRSASGPSGQNSAGSPSGSGKASASPGRSTATASSSPATVVDGWTVTTQPDGSVSYLRSFQVPGGSTVIRMVPGRVYLVSATPNPAYSVQSSESDPTRLVVEFIATGRYDVVDAMWWNDHPYAQVSRVG